MASNKQPYISIRMTGAVEVSGAIEKLPQRVRTLVVKTAIKAAAKPIRDAIQQNAPRGETGSMKDNVEMRISTRDGGTTVKCYIGIARGVKVAVKYSKRGLNLPPFITIPTRLAHLVEFGHEIVRHGVVIGHVAPNPFTRRAWQQAGGQVALNTFATALGTAIKEQFP